MADITRLFNSHTTQWAVPLYQGEKTPPLLWQERTTSLAQTEGIHTFVAYHNNTMVGALSFTPKNVLSGYLQWSDTSYSLSTDVAGWLKVQAINQEDRCGVETTVAAKHTTTKSRKRRDLNARGAEDNHFTTNYDPVAPINSVDKGALIYSDGVLRTYRLALVIDYSYFTTRFSSDISQVKAFWMNQEALLNELYSRDIGVKFEVLTDEVFIRKNKKEELFSTTKKADYVVDEGTCALDKIISRKKYDLAVIITNAKGGMSGLAFPYGAYNNNIKGCIWSRPHPMTIAHEIGHAFGATHTYANPAFDKISSDKTEPDLGNSVMSYGKDYPRDFFSLPSIYIIRRSLDTYMAYYTDKERTTKAGIQTEGHNDLVYGVKSTNHPPVLDKSSLQKVYTIPVNTFFAFHLQASDVDGNTLKYMAHQADIRKGLDAPNARFLPAKMSNNPLICYQTTYYNNPESGDRYTHPAGFKGDYTFWLAVSDHNPADPNHPVMYDAYETKVQVREGTPFQITSSIAENYQGGARIDLRWSVDPAIFGKDSKVRITLSDDMGASFKYILAEELPNNGHAQVQLPNVAIDKVAYPNYSKLLRGGVIKIEVIGHIAYALTRYRSSDGGGFTITPDPAAAIPLQLIGDLPKNITVDRAESIPQKATLQTIGGQGNITQNAEDLPIVQGDCPGRYHFERIYTVSDAATTLTHKQTITVYDDRPPLFDTFPENIKVPEMANVPPQATLTAHDLVSGEVTVKATEKREADKVTYHWEATDACGNTATHEQIITITGQKVAPLSFFAYFPPDIEVDCPADIPIEASMATRGGCKPIRIITEDRIEHPTGQEGYVLLRDYIATDVCGAQVSYTQRITVKGLCGEKPPKANPTPEPNPTPPMPQPPVTPPTPQPPVTPPVLQPEPPVTPMPKPPMVPPTHSVTPTTVTIYNVVSTVDAENYFRIEGTDADAPISVQIFNEMGIKVYSSDHYGEHGAFFRGKANVSGVISHSAYVPSGTYFYVIRYQLNGDVKIDKGYLFVK